MFILFALFLADVAFPYHPADVLVPPPYPSLIRCPRWLWQSSPFFGSTFGVKICQTHPKMGILIWKMMRNQ